MRVITLIRERASAISSGIIASLQGIVNTKGEHNADRERSFIARRTKPGMV
jgi:hypothetical protein